MNQNPLNAMVNFLQENEKAKPNSSMIPQLNASPLTSTHPYLQAISPINSILLSRVLNVSNPLLTSALPLNLIGNPMNTELLLTTPSIVSQLSAMNSLLQKQVSLPVKLVQTTSMPLLAPHQNLNNEVLHKIIQSIPNLVQSTQQPERPTKIVSPEAEDLPHGGKITIENQPCENSVPKNKITEVGSKVENKKADLNKAPQKKLKMESSRPETPCSHEDSQSTFLEDEDIEDEEEEVEIEDKKDLFRPGKHSYYLIKQNVKEIRLQPKRVSKDEMYKKPPEIPLDELIKQVAVVAEGLVGFQPLNRQKIIDVLIKHEMDPGLAIKRIKSNVRYYKKILRPKQEKIEQI